MSIRIRCEVEGYVPACPEESGTSAVLVVESDRDTRSRVVLRFGGKEIVVEADDLQLAVENASANHH